MLDWIKKIDVDLSFNSDWSQLNILWNKHISYNWYEFTFFNLNFEYHFNESESALRKSLHELCSVEFDIGLLGLNFSAYIVRRSC